MLLHGVGAGRAEVQVFLFRCQDTLAVFFAGKHVHTWKAFLDFAPLLGKAEHAPQRLQFPVHARYLKSSIAPLPNEFTYGFPGDRIEPAIRDFLERE